MSYVGCDYAIVNAYHTSTCTEFDANQDSPFEALHVVLLGVVKYFWCDAVSRQSAEGKTTLKARLTSVNVAGLEISALRAQTLVQYAGSLVGRDFHAILQVAPLVLYGLVPDAAYEAWLALCHLAPLIFQPVIMNSSIYFVSFVPGIHDIPSYDTESGPRVNSRAGYTTFWQRQHFEQLVGSTSPSFICSYTF